MLKIKPQVHGVVYRNRQIRVESTRKILFKNLLNQIIPKLKLILATKENKNLTRIKVNKN